MEQFAQIIKTATIKKDELAALPMVSYTGRIVLVDSVEEAQKAVEELMNETVIGFDTETKPSFKRGQTNNVALMQLSTHTTCYLFRLNHIGLPECLKAFLENEAILKIGVSIHDDFHNLHKLYQLNPANFIDLQAYVKQFNIHDNSLARIYGIVFGKRISKGQRLTNWEADALTAAQQNYAALDALACVQIYDYINSGKFIAEKSPYFRELLIDQTGEHVVNPEDVRNTSDSEPEK